jgi:hypothetical protein
MRPSLEGSLAALQSNDIGRVLLSSLDEVVVAGAIGAADPYGEMPALARAAAIVGSHVDPLDWLAHRLWCAKRRAQADRRPELVMRLEGEGHLRETFGHPTVLVSPMTMDTADALDLIRRVLADRTLVVFGEDVSADDIAVEGIEVPEPGQEISHILEVLGRGGVYCTYGDFAYRGRAVVPISLFGRPRAMSRGWVRIAARAGTMLLPLVMLRDGGDRALVTCQEPTLVQGRGDLQLLAEHLAGHLQQGIEAAGAQWLLLPTLTYDAVQSA